MTKISEKNFLPELLKAIPEFESVNKKNKEFHDIGIHLIMGDFKIFAENAVQEKNDKLLESIKSFLMRCHDESTDEVGNAVYVTFFENMNDIGLHYFFEHLPKEFAEDIKRFLDAFDKAISSKEYARLKNT